MTPNADSSLHPVLQPFGVTLALSDFRKNPGPTPIDIAGCRPIRLSPALGA
jgi:hypothetical protein